MAASTILDAVTTDTTTSGVPMTGDFEASAFGNAGGGQCIIERAVADVAAEYQPVGIEATFFGGGHVKITNSGTNYYRAKFIGCTRVANFSLKFNQA